MGLTALRMIDVSDMGFVPMQDFRGSLYLKLGLTSEQVDSLVGGVSEGQINYVDWLTFFTTSPICTTTDIGQFIRYGGASSTGERAGERDFLGNQDRYCISDLGPQSLAPIVA